MNDLELFEDFLTQERKKRTLNISIKDKIGEIFGSIMSFKNSITQTNDILLEKCYHCKKVCSPISLIETPTSFCGSTVCEVMVICPFCNKGYDYWAYGSYEREADLGQVESENPRMFKMIKLWSESRMG